MRKIEFKNLPDETTPINETNLNKMQENIDEDKIDKTGGTMTGALKVESRAEVRSLEVYAPTPFIDFHYNNSSQDYTSRIIEQSSGTLTMANNLAINNDLYVYGNGIQFGGQGHMIKFIWSGNGLELWVDNSYIGIVQTR